MSLINSNVERPILIVGKSSTGKSTKAKAMLDDPLVFYANEFNVESLPLDAHVLIEDVHYKPNKDAILNFLRNFKGRVVLTSLNKKSVPKPILNYCRVKLAGATQYSPTELAPRSVEPFNLERDIFGLVGNFLSNKDREEVRKLLIFNKPADVFLMNSLVESIHPNKLIYIDAKVKRRLSQRYLYEMLAYVHEGGISGRVTMPKFAQNRDQQRICIRLGLKPWEGYLLKDLLKDEQVKEYASKRLNNKEHRLAGLGEKRKRRNAPIIRQRRLSDWYE
jgi:hypothetical protein